MLKRKILKEKFDLPKALCGIFLFLLTVLVLLSLFAADIAPHDPLKIEHDLALQAPSAAFPFGTDDFGRCVFSRVLYVTLHRRRQFGGRDGGRHRIRLFRRLDR